PLFSLFTCRTSALKWTDAPRQAEILAACVVLLPIPLRLSAPPPACPDSPFFLHPWLSAPCSRRSFAPPDTAALPPVRLLCRHRLSQGSSQTDTCRGLSSQFLVSSGKTVVDP